MKISVILFIIIVSFIAGYQTKNDVLKDETLSTIRDNGKAVYIKLDDIIQYQQKYLYEADKIYKKWDKLFNESKNKKIEQPPFSATVKMRIPYEEYKKEFEPMYCDRVRKMLEDQLIDIIQVQNIFEPESGYYNFYAYINLNNFTSK